MHVDTYLGLLHGGERELAEALGQVAHHHAAEPDVVATCTLLAGWSREHVAALAPAIARYREADEPEAEDVHSELFRGPRSSGVGLVRDLHDLWVLASQTRMAWTVLQQAALALRDRELVDLAERCGGETDRQLAWLRTRIKQAAPQALVVA
jgi:hypothetical protein